MQQESVIWPENARLAVSIVVNVEEGSEMSIKFIKCLKMNLFVSVANIVHGSNIKIIGGKNLMTILS